VWARHIPASRWRPPAQARRVLPAGPTRSRCHACVPSPTPAARTNSAGRRRGGTRGWHRRHQTTDPSPRGADPAGRRRLPPQVKGWRRSKREREWAEIANGRPFWGPPLAAAATRQRAATAAGGEARRGARARWPAWSPPSRPLGGALGGREGLSRRFRGQDRQRCCMILELCR